MSTVGRSGSEAGGERVKFLPTVPPDVRHLYAQQWLLSERPERVQSAAVRLVTDERMRVQWEKLGRNFNATGGFVNDPSKWGEFFALAAINNFAQATSADAWDSMTQREQDQWQASLAKLASNLEELVKVAPVPPRGLPVPLEVLERFAQDIGLEVAFPMPAGFNYDESPQDRRSRGEAVTYAELNWAAEDSPWTLVHAVKHYQRQMAACVVEQPLKKPRDPKADRARFIVMLTGSCHSYYDQPMQELVATTAEVMFEDPGISVRVVRRLTVGK